MRIALTLAAASAALTACQSEDQIRERYRSEVVSQCTQRMGSGAPAGLDVQRFCACLAERTMAGRSASDLQNLNQSAGAAAGQEAAVQCIGEQGGAAPAANGSEVGNLSAQAQNTGAEAAQEATENASE